MKLRFSNYIRTEISIKLKNCLHIRGEGSLNRNLTLNILKGNKINFSNFDFTFVGMKLIYFLNLKPNKFN